VNGDRLPSLGGPPVAGFRRAVTAPWSSSSIRASPSVRKEVAAASHGGRRVRAVSWAVAQLSSTDWPASATNSPSVAARHEPYSTPHERHSDSSETSTRSTVPGASSVPRTCQTPISRSGSAVPCDPDVDPSPRSPSDPGPDVDPHAATANATSAASTTLRRPRTSCPSPLSERWWVVLRWTPSAAARFQNLPRGRHPAARCQPGVSSAARGSACWCSALR
jgi:hypothetical protein